MLCEKKNKNNLCLKHCVKTKKYFHKVYASLTVPEAFKNITAAQSLNL